MQGIHTEPDGDPVRTDESDGGGPSDDSESVRRSEDATGPGSDLESVSWDDVFFVLSNSRRRHTIRYLNGARSEPVRLRDLAEWIAAQENDVEPGAVTYNQRKRAYTSLYQSHLPKLDELGFVQLDRNRGEVRPTEATAQLERYLDELEGERPAGHRPALAVAGCCCALVLGAWAGVPPLASVQSHWIAALVAVAFLCVALAQVAIGR